MRTINDLIDFLHNDKTYDVRQHIVEQIVYTPDNNKGLFWEKVLEKAMRNHTQLIGGNNPYYDYTDGSDAKIGTFYKRNGQNTGKKEVSIGIKNKTGLLRVCLVVPGQFRHQVHFMRIPYHAYKDSKSSAIKFGLSPRGTPTGKLSIYRCSWLDVIAPV